MINFYKKYSENDIKSMMDYLEDILIATDRDDCFSYENNKKIVDAGMVIICLYADQQRIPARYMRMLKDARTQRVDPAIKLN